MGLASRKLGVPVRWIEDRLEHLAASSAASGSRHRGRGGVRVERRARRAPLRRDRGRRRLRSRARAGDALSDARLALRRLPSQERRRTKPGRPDEPLPTRAEPRLRRAAAVSRSRADDGDRGRGDSGSTRPSCARRNLDRAPTSSRTARLPAGSTTRATTRRASTTRCELARYDERRAERGRRVQKGGSSASGSPASSSRRSRTWVTSRSPSGRERRGGAAEVGERGGARPCSSRRSAESRVRLATTPQGQGHGPSRPDRRRPLGVAPHGRRGAYRHRHLHSPWTVASGNYSSRFSGVGAGAVLRAAEKVADKMRRSPRTCSSARPRTSSSPAARRA